MIAHPIHLHFDVLYMFEHLFVSQTDCSDFPVIAPVADADAGAGECGTCGLRRQQKCQRHQENKTC